jgi:N-acetylglucosamine-6-phosphate deacetylase
VIAGVHLEGPIISAQWPGAQNPEFIVPPQISWLEEWHQAYPGLVRMLTLAPEAEGAEAAVKWAVKRGMVAACGHTDATYEQMRNAIGWGLSHAVHCCNAMRPFHHREPGTVGAVLLHDEMTTELIVDGVHLHPAAVHLVHKTKAERVCLITDAMAASGGLSGTYDFSGLKVIVEDGVARLENGSLAGSALTMEKALQNFVFHHGVPLHEAVPHATSIPASIIGLGHAKGMLAEGRDADLLILDRNSLKVKRVMLGGHWIDKG